jgi:hypothetical protein
MNYEKVICGKCHKIIWSGGVPAMGADGDKVDDVFYHEKCANEMPEMSDDEKDYEAMKLDEYQMDNLVK